MLHICSSAYTIPYDNFLVQVTDLKMEWSTALPVLLAAARRLDPFFAFPGADVLVLLLPGAAGCCADGDAMRWLSRMRYTNASSTESYNWLPQSHPRRNTAATSSSPFCSFRSPSIPVNPLPLTEEPLTALLLYRHPSPSESGPIENVRALTCFPF
jgi:hypothetical protein